MKQQIYTGHKAGCDSRSNWMLCLSCSLSHMERGWSEEKVGEIVRKRWGGVGGVNVAYQ